MIDRACLSINNICNLHCRYCNFRQTNRITSDEDFSKSDIDGILHNILYYSRQNNIPMFKTGIVGAGEPLLSFDKIKYIIEYVNREDIDNIFTFYTITNGTLINEDMLTFFYNNRHRITLNFSLDGYENLHNYGKEAFQETLDGIKLYETVFQEKPLLQCTVNRQTLNNKEAVVNYFIEQNFEKVNFTLLFDVEEQDLMITHQEFLNFLQFVQNTKAIDFRQNRKEKKYDCRIYGQLCGVGRTNIFITKQGIYPCCRLYKNDTYKLADFDADLFEVESNMLKKIKPVKDGECYFDKYILNRSDL
jgi:uncharacterized protein